MINSLCPLKQVKKDRISHVQMYTSMAVGFPLEPWILYVVNSFLNLKFFIVKQQKPKALIFPERFCSLYVVLTLLNINFKCFKSAFRPRHIYVLGFKGGRLWDERWTFMG